MFQSLEAILSIDIEEELNYIVKVLKNKEERVVITEENCKKSLQLGFRFILLTHPDCQQVNYILCIGWKLLEGVSVHTEIVKHLINSDIVKDLYKNTKSVNCKRSETIKVIHWVLKTIPSSQGLEMAVKQHEIVHDNTAKADLASLADHIQLLCEQSSYFPPSTDLVLWCKNVVIFLAKVQIPRDAARQATFYAQVQQVEDFLQRVLSDINPEMRDDVVFGILKQLYAIISKPGSDPCPAACVVLSVVQPAVITSAVNWLIRGVEEASGSKIVESHSYILDTDTGLKTALITLCRWLCVWNHTPVLCNWVLSFMKALQDSEKFDILVDVSLEIVNELFDALLVPSMHSFVSHIFLYVLACMRHTMMLFHLIAPNTIMFLEKLASDNSPESRVTLQNLVEVLSEYFDTHLELKQEYPEIAVYLDSHIKSNKCNMKDVPMWQSTIDPQRQTRLPTGLYNMGNSCYMNSVFQALLNTKQFSNGVILYDSQLPIMCQLGTLFALLLYSARPSVNASTVYKITVPSNFVLGSQQDSSEFLCHLLDTMHEQEKYCLMANFNGKFKAHKPGTSKSNNNFVMDSDAMSSNANFEAIASTASSSKDISWNTPERMEVAGNSSQKRKCDGLAGEQGPSTSEKLVAQTIVQRVFGGVLTTSVRCSYCLKISTKKDVFRDLQLSFPEKYSVANTQRSYSVQELLDFYCSSESLCGENKYFCSNCNCLRDAQRSIAVNKAPKNLILVLKYFWYDPKNQIRAKLLNRVVHNKNIHIIEGDSSINYELYTAVVHSGNQLDSGHYYTLVKDSPHAWYKLNDSLITRSSEEELHDLQLPCTPYILFYKKIENVSKDNPDKEEVLMEQMKSSSSSSRMDDSYEKRTGMTDGGACSNMKFDFSEESLPYECLPTQMMEYIRDDNIKFENEFKRDRRTTRSMAKEQFNHSPRDSDDDPPSSCGGTNNIEFNFNKYIY